MLFMATCQILMPDTASFADEIFRVFRVQNPNVNIRWVNENKDVRKMILRAKSHR